jgi:hypothetical protein
MKASLIRWLYSAPNVIPLRAKIGRVLQKYAIARGSKKGFYASAGRVVDTIV